MLQQKNTDLATSRPPHVNGVIVNLVVLSIIIIIVGLQGLRSAALNNSVIITINDRTFAFG
jgi:hypothetical protein